MSLSKSGIRDSANCQVVYASAAAETTPHINLPAGIPKIRKAAAFTRVAIETQLIHKNAR